MTSSSFQGIIDFILRTVEGADVDLDSVRVGVAIYRREGTILFNLDEYQGSKDRLVEAIRGIRLSYKSQDSNLPAGLELVSRQMFGGPGDRDSVPNGLIIVTDDNSEPQYR